MQDTWTIHHVSYDFRVAPLGEGSEMLMIRPENEDFVFAAWIGLVPRQDSTGGKQKLGPISKQGDRYLRRILVVGAIAVLRRAPRRIPGSIPGSRTSWRGDPSRSWRWRSPTRWRAWPGRCWPMVAPIGRLSLLKLPKGARRGREEEM